ncbi:MAG: hypothetical protein KJO01_01360 [Gammaproteobacteria bacterium]|nr:hypothetical protein [Gammaproteobacteria bacterium]MBT8109717.1 hypothetical protein [Gammaproteobacteria bacterium]NND48285.1 hypothetical protein [Woeseiaceae bacterium]NNL44419.1 hypothetical protein [Woeseiaceae bacterium]
MHRMLILLLFLLTALPVCGQEADGTDPESTDAQPEETAEPREEAAEDAIDDDAFSDELYTEEEDAFIPSENVKFGQSIPFPTDI